MAKADPEIHKDLTITRVPLSVAKKLEEDAEKGDVSKSHIVRRILRQYYGLLKKVG